MFNRKFHYKWSCSIAMLNYQRVTIDITPTNPSGPGSPWAQWCPPRRASGTQWPDGQWRTSKLPVVEKKNWKPHEAPIFDGKNHGSNQHSEDGWLWGRLLIWQESGKQGIRTNSSQVLRLLWEFPQLLYTSIYYHLLVMYIIVHVKKLNVKI